MNQACLPTAQTRDCKQPAMIPRARSLRRFDIVLRRDSIPCGLGQTMNRIRMLALRADGTPRRSHRSALLSAFGAFFAAESQARTSWGIIHHRCGLKPCWVATLTGKNGSGRKERIDRKEGRGAPSSAD